MLSHTPRATARIHGHPVHTLLAPIPFVCFLGTLITDIVYARTAEMQWANFSMWMLTVGLLVSVLVAVAGLIDFVANRGLRRRRATWIHGAGDAVALLLAIINAFVHTRDAYTSVVPEGLILSALVVIILMAVGWNDRNMTPVEERP
jgi:uncharacterized membrane protein